MKKERKGKEKRERGRKGKKKKKKKELKRKNSTFSNRILPFIIIFSRFRWLKFR